MIVKNEADYIAQTLLSTKPHIDYWTVVDTGECDSTSRITAASASIDEAAQLLIPADPLCNSKTIFDCTHWCACRIHVMTLVTRVQTRAHQPLCPPAAAGSTDDTEAIVSKTMEGVPGQLLRSKFVDFAQVGCPIMTLASCASVHSLNLQQNSRLQQRMKGRGCCRRATWR
jgi:hypothetical protein